MQVGRVGENALPCPTRCAFLVRVASGSGALGSTVSFSHTEAGRYEPALQLCKRSNVVRVNRARMCSMYTRKERAPTIRFMHIPLSKNHPTHPRRGWSGVYSHGPLNNGADRFPSAPLSATGLHQQSRAEGQGR